jgi:hypothetical protein
MSDQFLQEILYAKLLHQGCKTFLGPSYPGNHILYYDTKHFLRSLFQFSPYIKNCVSVHMHCAQSAKKITFISHSTVVGPQYETYSMSPFWSLKFGVSAGISGKVCAPILILFQ